MFSNVTISKKLPSRSSFRNMIMMTTSLSSIAKMLLIFMTIQLMLNSPINAATTLAEIELNDLNTIETTMKPLSNNTATFAKQQQQKQQPETRQYPYPGFMMPGARPVPPSIPGCPLCDASVYSYCSHKLIHDSCCCDFAGVQVYQKPPQCVYFDCSLLYAKSCYEHSLIKNCCCNNPY